MSECRICGKDCNGQTCSGACRAKLSRAHAHGQGARAQAHAEGARPEFSVTEGKPALHDCAGDAISVPTIPQSPLDNGYDVVLSDGQILHRTPTAITDPLLRQLSKQYDIINNRQTSGINLC